MTIHKPLDEQALGLDLDGRRLKAALVALKNGTPKVEKLFETSTSLIDEGLKDAVSKYLTVSGVSAQDILIRKLRIKLIKEKDVEDAFTFQAEPLLPFPVDNGILDKIILEKDDISTTLTLGAVRKDLLQTHLEAFQALDIEPEATSAVPTALASFAQFIHPELEELLVLNIGLETSTCVFVKNGKLVSSAATPTGLQTLQNAYSKDCETLEDPTPFTELDFSSELPPLLSEAVQKFTQDILWMLFAKAKESKSQPLALLLTGDGADLNHIVCEPQFNLLTSAPDAKFAVAIGLALGGLIGAENSMNFRQAELAYPHTWRRYKNSLGLYALGCLGVALAFFLFGQAYLGYQEDKLKQRYVEMLALIQKPYDTFEGEFLSKHAKNEEDALTLKALSQEDLSQRLSFLDKKIKEMPEVYPLLPNVPRVSDVLAWLSNHPKVLCKTQDLSCALQIENFAYTLVKRPDQAKKNEKYQVKIDLEFNTPSPQYAREFHDALIAPNDLVDPKGEVKWNSSKGKYKTSFFLKDKTQYINAPREGG